MYLFNYGKLKAGQVRPLVGRYNALSLANSIIKENLSSRSIENLVKREKELEDQKNKPKKSTDVNILLAQRKIEESLGLFFPSRAILAEIIFSKSISAINVFGEISSSIKSFEEVILFFMCAHSISADTSPLPNCINSLLFKDKDKIT